MDSSISQIDEAILSVTPLSWVKVAFVIAMVDKEFRNKMRKDIELDLIAERVEALIQEGRLAVQGDVKNWRYSEVRKRDEVVLA